MFDTIAASEARISPLKSTRSQVKLEDEKHLLSTSKATGKTGRLVNPTDQDSPAMNVTILDGVFSMFAFGCCDNGSDDSLVSSASLRPPCNRELRNFAKSPPSI